MEWYKIHCVFLTSLSHSLTSLKRYFFIGIKMISCYQIKHFRRTTSMYWSFRLLWLIFTVALNDRPSKKKKTEHENSAKNISNTKITRIQRVSLAALCDIGKKRSKINIQRFMIRWVEANFRQLLINYAR